ncbi:MAG: helix-turn-helix domain-containing protein [Acidobacteriota bacterium]|nr:helix-turn-helix domain-containing protein [Acidobacteriota bacterium]
MDKKILVAEEVAAIFRVDKQRIYELTRTNQLPGIIRLGERQYRYSAQAIEQFLHGGGNTKETEVKNSER